MVYVKPQYISEWSKLQCFHICLGIVVHAMIDEQHPLHALLYTRIILKIMHLKKGVGIDHYNKSKETRYKNHALANVSNRVS